MSDIDLSLEKKKIDNFLITSSSTLIAGFLVLLSLKKAIPFYSKLASIISITLLVFSILFTLWHKYRSTLKEIIFEEKKDEFYDEFEKTIGEFSDLIYQSLVLKKHQITEDIISDENLESEEEAHEYLQSDDFNERIKNEVRDKLEEPNHLISAIAKSSSQDLKRAHTEVYRRPLDENFAKTKFVTDLIAEKTRYLLFTLGLISFLVSIILSTLNL